MDTHAKPSSVTKALEILLLGKLHEIKLSLACVLSGGHLFLEDVPGVGKTTLAQGLARQLGLQNTRIQFTSDLLPSEITGGSIFDPVANEYRVHRGPIFTQLVIADEINRATPLEHQATSNYRTQCSSARELGIFLFRCHTRNTRKTRPGGLKLMLE